MCGKTAVTHLHWKDVYSWANALTPPAALPPDPEDRVNVSPSRLRRKKDPDSMIWETLPTIVAQGEEDVPGEAVWPFIPHWSAGRLPSTRAGKVLSTANARLKDGPDPFAPTFMTAWRKRSRALVIVSWFYEFDGRVHPKVPYAVFPLENRFWVMAALAGRYRESDGTPRQSVAVITVGPNEVLKSVGHHRSPALLRSPEEARAWLRGDDDDALALLRPHPDDTMGVEAVPMSIKIPGNENVELPPALARRAD